MSEEDEDAAPGPLLVSGGRLPLAAHLADCGDEDADVEARPCVANIL